MKTTIYSSCRKLDSNRLILLLVILAFSVSPLAHAVDREDVTFEINHQSAEGERVFLVGDLPELGGGDVRRAISMLSSGGDLWRITVSLPVNRTYRYRYFVQPDAGIGSPCGGTPTWIGATREGETGRVESNPSYKRLVYRSDFVSPVLHWREEGFFFDSIDMLDAGPAPNTGESTWVAAGFSEAGRSYDFFIEDATRERRDPPSGFYTTPLDTALLQAGHLFDYVSAASVSPHRRDYDPLDPPKINSAFLGGEFRPYRVVLPRGYDEHTDRNYPVVYRHDGQGFFDIEPARPREPFDAGGDRIAALIQMGQVREVIVVAIDTFRDGRRPRDYLPPGDCDQDPNSGMFVCGEADKYVAFITEELKPLIDASYRTLPDAQHTGTWGASFGGLVSMYMGWDFSETFANVISHSGSFWDVLTFPNEDFDDFEFTKRLLSEPRRDIRIYLDTGDVSDNGRENFLIRESFLTKSPQAHVLEKDLRYLLACGHEHDRDFFRQRIPEALTFAFPPAEDETTLVSDCNANSTPDADEISAEASLDSDADGQIDVCEPDCNANGSPDENDIAGGSSADCNGNGRPDECERDCNGNGVPDECDLLSGQSADCNENGIPDECDIPVGTGQLCDVWSSEEVGVIEPFADATTHSSRLGAANGCMLVLGTEGDLVGRNDRFHYVHELQGGDFTLTARISDWQDAAEGSKLGVMIREDLGVGARTGTVLLEKTEDGFQHLFFRRTILTRTFTHETYESPEVWLRIEKAGNDILGSLSTDGSNWSEPDTVTLSGLPRRIHVGVFSSYVGDLPSLATVCDVTLQPEHIPTQFIRGDGNGDGSVNIADASYVANFLFGVAPATPPPCEAAGDGNGDGRINIADASFIANFLFGIGIAAPPPAPYPDCGFPDGEPLSCDDPWGCAE